MSTRFEILKNGQRICIAGINGAGVLSVDLTYMKGAGQQEAHHLQITGMGTFEDSQDRQCPAEWPSSGVGFGDDITIRVLPTGKFDQPLRISNNP
ncbi:MAG: hypothetical protein AAFN70_12340 [Planctomycetota bacterium]